MVFHSTAVNLSLRSKDPLSFTQAQFMVWQASAMFAALDAASSLAQAASVNMANTVIAALIGISQFP